MRHLGLRGAMRGKVVRTTIGDARAPCPPDRVNRQFRAERPNQLWLSVFRAAGIQKAHLPVFRSNTSGLAFWRSVGAEERRSGLGTRILAS